MTNYRFSILLSFALIMSACSKEIPLPDIDKNPLLVVNSLIRPDTTMQVHLSESCHISNNNCDPKLIQDAIVELKDKSGSTLATLMHDANGVYTLDDDYLEYDQSYILEVSHSSLGQNTMTAEAKIPSDFSCQLISTEQIIIEQNHLWGFEIEIEDNPDEENFYILQGYFELIGAEHDQDYESEKNGYIEPYFRHFSDDANVENNFLTSGLDYRAAPLKNVYLPDKNFNGETYRTQFGVGNYALYKNSPEAVIAHVYVKSVSKEMYDYLKSVELFQLSQGNIFAEPVQVISNIDNGLGIFAGYTQKTMYSELPEPDYLLLTDVFVENDNCTGPCTMTFSTNGGDNAAYTWTVDGAIISTAPTAEHTFDTAGIYTVSVDSNIISGDFAFFEFPVTVR